MVRFSRFFSPSAAALPATPDGADKARALASFFAMTSPTSNRDLIYLLYVREDASRWSSRGGFFSRMAPPRAATRWFHQIFADWLFCSARRSRRLHAYARPASRPRQPWGERYHGHLPEHATREIQERRRLRAIQAHLRGRAAPSQDFARLPAPDVVDPSRRPDLAQ